MPINKFIDSNKLESDLTAVANAIRSKTGTTEALSFPNGYIEDIGKNKLLVYKK